MSSINLGKLFSRTGVILQHLARACDHRSQLAALESIEARAAVLKFGLLALALLFCAALGVMMLGLIIAAIVWPLENRVAIFGCITLGFGALTGLVAFILRRRIHAWTPWSETRRQLREDCACLGEMIKDVGSSDES